MRRSLRIALGAGIGVGLVSGALVVACAGDRQQAGSHGMQTPLGVTSQSGKAAVAAAPTLSIAEFQPLLAEPELAKAAKLMDAGQTGLAAREIETQMTKRQLPASEVPRWQMLLGRVREASGDLAGAAASYELAQKENWPLAGYAALGIGRVLLRSGKPGKALEWLDKVPAEGPLGVSASLLMAEAAVREKKPDKAIQAWRAYLGTKPQDAMDVSLKLAGALLDRAALAGADATHASADVAVKNADIVEALALARRAAALGASLPTVVGRARVLEKRALDALPASERSKYALPSPEDELTRLKALVDARLEGEAEKTADTLIASLDKSKKNGPVGCEAGILRGKAIALKKDTGRAFEAMDEVAKRCITDEDIGARALFLAGRYAADDGRDTIAVERWAALEKRYPKHRLADDARMNAALSYFELGVEARFTELLSSMPEDYPDGDMVYDAVFRLALRRIERDDWSGAASVLDKIADVSKKGDAARGTESSGRERYFRARALIETGEKERGYDEIEAIVRELPLSYYMLHAYTRLNEVDPGRAKRAVEEAQKKAVTQPFTFARLPQLDSPGFRRALELLRQSQFAEAKSEVEALGLVKQGALPEVLWGLALLYSRAGSAKDAHEIARGLLTDWLSRWPAGDWVKAWELAFPRPYDKLVALEAKKNGIPESLVYAVMREESAFDPDAVSHADAHGLMQLIVPTAKLLAKPVGLPYDADSLKRPAINISLGSRGLGELTLKTFAQNPLLAIPAYNAGPGRPRRWLRERPRMEFDVWVESIPITETRRYTKRVLASRAAYAYLYEKRTAPESMALPLRLTP